tara:strand:- start:996 stop:1745 length:750 start_codon:yes stop_codon:yes gene_type:complete
MLVTLGQNETVAATSSSTFTYSPRSVQKVLLRLANSAWETTKITVQIGSVTIVNACESWGLAGLSTLSSMSELNIANDRACFELDLGSHECTGNANLYVTIQTGASQVTGVDISAIVDEPCDVFPIRLTQYSDNTFTSPNNLAGIAYDAGYASIEDDTTRCEIKSSISSSSPSFTSSTSYFVSKSFSLEANGKFGLLNVQPRPIDTTYNYPSGGTADRIITVEQMPTTRKELSSARQAQVVSRLASGVK